MNIQHAIDAALAAADKPIMVETATRLEQSLKTWLNCEALGIDTEFVRERTWRADLGLIQISDGLTVWLIDPIKTGPLDSLSALLGEQTVCKILHAPSEDLDVLLYATGAVPEPLFDTQTACAMLGQSLQMGYHTTVEWLLDVTVDKGETRSNWCKRPLRPAQLHYAALDVCLLPIMYRQLRTLLGDIGRDKWLAEDCARMLKKAQTPPDPEQSWRRINGNGRLDGVALAILQALAKWRDRVAEERNLARGFVIKDTALLSIARQQPASLDALSELDVWHPGAIRRRGPEVLAIIDRVLQEGLVADLPELLSPGQRQLLKSMRNLVLERSAELSVEPALLASKRELEALILSPAGQLLPERFTGWRKDVITNDLVVLKDKLT
jgi:ribonuclease D